MCVVAQSAGQAGWFCAGVCCQRACRPALMPLRLFNSGIQETAGIVSRDPQEGNRHDSSWDRAGA